MHRTSAVTTILVALATLVAPTDCPAQALKPATLGGIETLLTETEVLRFSLDTDTDPSNLVFAPNGGLIYIDTEPGFDQVLFLDLANGGQISLIADEASLGGVAPGSATSVVAFESIVVANDQSLYLLLGDVQSPGVAPVYVARIPFTGIGPSGYEQSNISLAGTFFATAEFNQQMVYEPALDTLFFLRDNGNANNDLPGPGTNGLFALPLATPQPFGLAQYFQVAGHTQISGALSPIPVVGIHDLGAKCIAPGHGFLYFGNTFTDSNAFPNNDTVAGEGYDGDIVRVDMITGQATPFIDREQFLADTNAALGLSRGPGDQVHALNLMIDEARDILYVFEDVPHSAVPGGQPPAGLAATESLVAYDSQTAEFLGVVASNKALRDHYEAEKEVDWPSASNTSFTLANYPFTVGPDHAVYIFFVNVGERLIRVKWRRP